MSNTNRPNILWISIEDVSPRYGCYGDPVARTPNLDRLAAGGCRYPNAFSTAPVCAPSRSAVITGMYATSIGTHHMRTTHSNRNTPEMPTPYSAVIPHYAKLLPEYLRAAGYYCTNNVKTDYQFDPPRTAWDELSTTAHWRNRPDKDQPFFAVFNPTMTHESGMWPHEDKPPVKTDPASVTLPPYLPDTPECREALARHYDNLADADAVVGQLLAQLEEDGLAENTIVVNWSDHGEGLPRAKRWPYDAGIRVPMIVRWPGQIEADSVSDDLVSLIDLAPTMLSVADQQIPQHMQGQAFLGSRKADTPREYIFASRDRFDESYDMIRAARDKQFKYLRNFRPDLPYLLWIPYRNRHPIVQKMWELHAADELTGPQKLMFQTSRPPEELYDVEADPHEINNLAEDPAYADDLARLRGAMEGWRQTVGDMGEIPEVEMVRQWYPNGEQPRTAGVVAIPHCQASPGQEAMAEGSLSGPVLIQLHCATQGASIAWTTEPGEEVHWHLYTGPIRLEPGQTTLRLIATRIGYLESEERSVTYTVTDS